MTDVVVTVPKGIWFDWIAEGDAVGEPPTGEEWGFYTAGGTPDIGPTQTPEQVEARSVREGAMLLKAPTAGKDLPK